MTKFQLLALIVGSSALAVPTQPTHADKMQEDDLDEMREENAAFVQSTGNQQLTEAQLERAQLEQEMNAHLAKALELHLKMNTRPEEENAKEVATVDEGDQASPAEKKDGGWNRCCRSVDTRDECKGGTFPEFVANIGWGSSDFFKTQYCCKGKYSKGFGQMSHGFSAMTSVFSGDYASMKAITECDDGQQPMNPVETKMMKCTMLPSPKTSSWSTKYYFATVNHDDATVLPSSDPFADVPKIIRCTPVGYFNPES